MGRGAGEKNRFYKFLDESYFAFWFRHWAAAFIAIGVVLIIVGAVVSQVIPPQKYQEFAQAQIVATADDPNYPNWVEKVERVRYDFLDVDAATLDRTTKGPYIFSTILKKADVSFSDDSVSYTLSASRTFAVSESANPSAEISLVNPTYAQLVSAKGGELDFFADVFDPDLITNLKTFYSTQAYKFISSLGLAQKFASVFTAVRENEIFPTIFSPAGLGKAVSNYKFRYAATQIPQMECAYCDPENEVPPKGIKSSLYLAFIQNNDCKFGYTPSQAQFLEFFVSGFAAATNANACGVFLQAHKVTADHWDQPGDDTIAWAILNSLDVTGSGVQSWIDLVDPETKGYCGDRPSAMTAFSASTAQIDDICDVFIPSFFPDVTPSGEDLELLGKKRLCLTTPVAGPSLVLPTALPTGVSLTLEGSLMNTYNDANCDKYLDALVDTSDFAIPVYDDSSLSGATWGLSAADVTRLYNYIHALDSTYKYWFSSLWVDDQATYEDACDITPCPFPAFAAHANPSVFNATEDLSTSIIFMLFPELSPEANKVLRTRYSLTNTNPSVEGQNLNLFSNVTAQGAHGMLSWHYPENPVFPNQVKAVGGFGLTDPQFDEVKNFVSGASTAYAEDLPGSDSVSDAGYLQFAQARFACGPNSIDPAERCSMESKFFGLTTQTFYYEFGIASYVTTALPIYFESFTNADNGERDSMNALGAFNLLTAIEADHENVLAGSPTDVTRKYLMFLMSTYVRAAYVPASSGIFAKRTAFEWLTGYVDEAAEDFPEGGVNAEYAIDPAGGLLDLTVETGANDILTAYLYKAVNGAGTVSAYQPADNVVGAFNYDGLPPTKVTAGSTVTFFDPLLMRNVKVAFAQETTDEAAGVIATKGTFSDDDWNTGSHNITTKNLLPVPGVSGSYRSSCSVALPSSVRSFPSTPGGADAFPAASTIYADLNTGLVVRLETCFLYSATVINDEYPFTGYGLDQEGDGIIFTQVMRRSVRQIGADQADAYLLQYRQVTDTSTAILLALVIVGALFVLTGVVFLIFWFIRRNRKMSQKADMDLVQDPFGEKKSNVGNLKY